MRLMQPWEGQREPRRPRFSWMALFALVVAAAALVTAIIGLARSESFGGRAPSGSVAASPSSTTRPTNTTEANRAFCTDIAPLMTEVDRIGQAHPVQVANLAAENSVDARVLEVLETKLAVILAELGADKAGDILNSADHFAEGLYVAAIIGPDMSEAGSQFESTTRSEAEGASEFLDLVESASSTPTIGKGEDPRPWFDMAMAARGNLLADMTPRHSPIDHLPEVSPAEPIPAVNGSRNGLFSLWEVNGRPGERSCAAVFLTEQQAARPDIADLIWDQLAQGVTAEITPPLDEEEWRALWEAGWGYAVRPDHYQSGEAPPPALTLRLLVRVLP